MTSKPWPWNTLRPPAPADWGVGMTVCIAAHSSMGKSIVCVTDMMVSMSDMSMSSDETALKMAYFGDKRTVMMAGDLSCYRDIRRHIKDYLLKEGPETGTNSMSCDRFSDAIKYAFESEIRRRAESEILYPYGLGFSNYRDEGPKLGPDIYSRMLHELRYYELGLELLVAGFDEDSGHIFTVKKNGIAQHMDRAWAIGSGEVAALGYLFSSQTTVISDEETVFYRACCAKFAAETSPGVGKKTLIILMREDGKRFMFRDLTIAPIRSDWESSQKTNLAPDKVKMVAGVIGDLIRTHEAAEQNTEAKK